MPISFIHTADIHFGVENYGHIDPKTGLHTRLLDFKESFEYIVDYAIEKNVDCFLFAGDAYKNCHPSPTHQRVLVKLFLKLLDHGIPVVIVVGNHDHSGNYSKAHALDVFYHIKHPLCYIFSKPGLMQIITKNGPLNIVGIPWPFYGMLSKEKQYNGTLVHDIIMRYINEYRCTMDPELPAVLVGHMMVEKGTFSGSERSIIHGKDPYFTVEELAKAPFDYVALGHLHRYQWLNSNKVGQQPPVVYSGSPDRIDFGEKNETKSFIYGVIEDKKTVFSVIPILCRPFYEIIIHVEKVDDIAVHIAEKITQCPHFEKSIIKLKYTYNSEDIKYLDSSLFQEHIKHAHCIASIECMNKLHYRRRSIPIDFKELQSLDDLFSFWLEHKQLPEKEKEESMVVFHDYFEKYKDSCK